MTDRNELVDELRGGWLDTDTLDRMLAGGSTPTTPLRATRRLRVYCSPSPRWGTAGIWCTRRRTWPSRWSWCSSGLLFLPRSTGDRAEHRRARGRGVTEGRSERWSSSAPSSDRRGSPRPASFRTRRKTPSPTCSTRWGSPSPPGATVPRAPARSSRGSPPRPTRAGSTRVPRSHPSRAAAGAGPGSTDRRGPPEEVMALRRRTRRTEGAPAPRTPPATARAAPARAPAMKQVRVGAMRVQATHRSRRRFPRGRPSRRCTTTDRISVRRRDRPRRDRG